MFKLDVHVDIKDPKLATRFRREYIYLQHYNLNVSPHYEEENIRPIKLTLIYNNIDRYTISFRPSESKYALYFIDKDVEDFLETYKLLGIDIHDYMQGKINNE